MKHRESGNHRQEAQQDVVRSPSHDYTKSSPEHKPSPFGLAKASDETFDDDFEIEGHRELRPMGPAGSLTVTLGRRLLQCTLREVLAPGLGVALETAVSAVIDALPDLHDAATVDLAAAMQVIEDWTRADSLVVIALRGPSDLLMLLRHAEARDALTDLLVEQSVEAASRHAVRAALDAMIGAGRPSAAPHSTPSQRAVVVLVSPEGRERLRGTAESAPPARSAEHQGRS